MDIKHVFLAVRSVLFFIERRERRYHLSHHNPGLAPSNILSNHAQNGDNSSEQGDRNYPIQKDGFVQDRETSRKLE